LNWDIVDAMSTVKELMLSPAGTEAVAAGLDEVAAADVLGALDEGAVVVDEDEEQPAASTATTAAAATKPSRGLFVPWPSERESHPPCLLLPSSIPCPFRYNALGYADAGHRKARVSVRHES
jgi:hypothetical protein